MNAQRGEESSILRGFPCLPGLSDDDGGGDVDVCATV